MTERGNAALWGPAACLLRTADYTALRHSLLPCSALSGVLLCPQMCAQKAYRTVKIGDKVISLEQARALVERIFHLRSTGSTQREVASMLGVERSFISHLEGLGEVRRRQIALIASAAPDPEKIDRVARELDIDLVHITEGPTGLRDVLDLLAAAKELDFVVFLGPAEEAALIEQVIDTRTVSIPLQEAGRLKEILGELAEKRTRRAFRSVKRGEKKSERGSKRKSWLLSSRPRSDS